MIVDRFMQIIWIIHDNERNSALRKIIPQLVCVAELPDWLESTTDALGTAEPTWNMECEPQQLIDVYGWFILPAGVMLKY